ncbi:MAG: histidinol-phosphate transaminase [Pseudomonadota bacterium]
MSIVDLARPELRDLQPYEAAIQVDDTIRLNANEAPWSSSNAGDFRRPLNRYPEIRPARLQKALAARFGCMPERLLVTRGTSEAIDLLVRAFCRSGLDEIVTTSPTFSMYAHYARIQDAKLVTVAADPDKNFVPELDALLHACGENTRLVFLCSPNNPTGTGLPRTLIRQFLRARGDRSAVVVDEAYIEFSGEASTAELLDEFPNLIVLRTLSKALAFAGARCGAVMGPQAVIDILSAIQAPYALSTPVVECVEDALSKRRIEEAAERVNELIAEREALAASLAGLGFVLKVWPSSANFLLVKVRDVGAVMAATRKACILLRYFGGELADCVRISIGSPAENRALLDTLRTLNESSHVT